MSFIKRRSVHIGLLVLTVSILTLIALPSMATAGELVEECNRQHRLPLGQGKSDDGIATAAHRRLDCYAEKMVLIKQEVIDIKTLNKEIVRIRGSRRGTETKHSCPPKWPDRLEGSLARFYNSDTLHDYFDSAGGDITINFPVAGGVCSSYWNEQVANENEFLRLACHVGFSVKEKTYVVPAFKSAQENKRKYRICFNRNISQEIKNEFEINNAAEFRKVLNKKLRKWRSLKMKSQYDELAQSCESLANSIANKYTNYAKKNPLYCDQWVN